LALEKASGNNASELAGLLDSCALGTAFLDPRGQSYQIKAYLYLFGRAIEAEASRNLCPHPFCVTPGEAKEALEVS